MPIYEYQCKKCGHLSEVLQKFSDPPISKCEICNGRMKKLISHSSFHLKGTGWYVTDYASKSSGDSGSSENRKASAKASTDSADKTSKIEAKGNSDNPTKNAASKTKE